MSVGARGEGRRILGGNGHEGRRRGRSGLQCVWRRTIGDAGWVGNASRGSLV